MTARIRQTCLIVPLLPLLAVLLGCGDEEAAEPVSAPVAKAPPRPAAPHQAKAAPAAKLKPPAKVEPPPPPPEPVKRPDDLAKWQPDDFRAARSEGDAKLPDALKLLGERTAGDSSAVRVIVDSIKKPVEGAAATPAGPGAAPRPGRRPAGGATVTAGTLTAAIDALGRNGTSDADQALEQLLTGQLETGAQPKAVSDAVLTSLVSYPSPQRGELLLSAAFTPEKFQAAASDQANPSGGGRNAMQLRTDVLARLKSAANSELRTRIAERMWSEPLSPEERRPFVDMLLEPRGDNVASQMLLLRQTELPPESKLKLQQLFVQLASAALDQMLGIPQAFKVQPVAGYRRTAARGGSSGPQFSSREAKLPPGFSFNPSRDPAAAKRAGGRAPRDSAAQHQVALDPQVPYQLAQRLWTAEFQQTVWAGTEQRKRLDENIPAAILGGAIPQQQSREQFARLNRGMWSVGPRSIPQSTLFGDQLRDPGLLPIIKLSPRKEDPVKSEARKGTTETQRSSRGRQRSSPPTVNPKDVPRHEWMQASEELVYVLNQRFHAAASAKSSGPAAPQAVASITPAATANSEPANSAEGAAQEKPANGGTPNDVDRPEDDVFGTRSKAARAQPRIGDGLPVELHDGAQVVAEYHLHWPHDLGDKLSTLEVTPLVIHYVRIEESNRVGKLMTHYQKFLKGAKLRYLDHGRWIDHLDAGTSTGNLRSVDVMITTAETKATAGSAPRPAGAGEKSKNADEPLVVEILSIEIPRPPGEADDPSAAQSATSAPTDPGDESGVDR